MSRGERTRRFHLLTAVRSRARAFEHAVSHLNCAAESNGILPRSHTVGGDFGSYGDAETRVRRRWKELHRALKNCQKAGIDPTGEYEFRLAMAWDWYRPILATRLVSGGTP